MGIFDDFGVDPDKVQEAGNFNVEDGVYHFEVAEAEILEGTTNKPDTTFFYIDFQLFDEDGDPVGSTRTWYTMAEDGDSETAQAQRSAGYLKADAKALGVTDLHNFDGSEIIGVKGVLRLVSTPGKGKNKGNTYQNVRNIRRTEEEVEEAPAPKKAAAKKPAASTAKADAEAKARVKANQAARAAEAEPEDDGDDDSNPFG